MDFVHDQLATGRKLRILTIVDIHSRYAPATNPRFSYRGEDVVQTLERACQEVGHPQTIRVDNGSEFVSRDLDLWAYRRGVILDCSWPGQPADSAYIESFNGKLRAECLNQHWFLTFDGARAKMEEWRKDYNEVRPHSAIGNKPPISRMNASGASGPPLEQPPENPPTGWFKEGGERQKREKLPARVVQTSAAGHFLKYVQGSTAAFVGQVFAVRFFHRSSGPNQTTKRPAQQPLRYSTRKPSCSLG